MSRIEKQQVGNVTVLRLSGKFDTAHGGGDLIAALEKIMIGPITDENIAKKLYAKVVLNVQDLTAIDHTVIGRMESLRDKSGYIGLCGEPDKISSSPSCTKLYMTFPADPKGTSDYSEPAAIIACP